MPLKDIDIILRPFDVDDAKAFMAWASDDDVTSFLTWNSYQSLEEAKIFLKEIAMPHPWFKAICHQDEVIGSITLDKTIFEGQEVLELGYVIAKKYWGKGYATQAVQETLRMGPISNGIKTVVAFVDPTNQASKRVLEKSGFQYRTHLSKFRQIKGEWKDRDVFAFS